MRHFLLFLILSGVLSVTSQAYAGEIKASFNCKKASTAIEKAICSSQALADLDVTLSKAYKQIRKDVSKQKLKIIKASQRHWFKQRNSNCKGKTDSNLQECLTGSMSRRIKELEGYMALSIPEYSGKPAYEHSKYAFLIKTLPDDYTISAKIIAYPNGERELHLEIIDKKIRKQVGHIAAFYWCRACALYPGGKFKIDGIVADKRRGPEPKWQHKEEGQEYMSYGMETSLAKRRDIIVKADMQLRMTLWFEMNMDFVLDR